VLKSTRRRVLKMRILLLKSYFWRMPKVARLVGLLERSFRCFSHTHSRAYHTCITAHWRSAAPLFPVSH
jgi:hypothetical protein